MVYEPETVCPVPVTLPDNSNKVLLASESVPVNVPFCPVDVKETLKQAEKTLAIGPLPFKSKAVVVVAETRLLPFGTKSASMLNDSPVEGVSENSH